MSGQDRPALFRMLAVVARRTEPFHIKRLGIVSMVGRRPAAAVASLAVVGPLDLP